MELDIKILLEILLIAFIVYKMIKCIIFDLDGVLIDSKELHYESLNLALLEIDNQYIISEEEHIKKMLLI